MVKPKEHGAYAILAIPIVTGLVGTGLVGGGVSLAGPLVAVAAVAGFFAHEPLLVSLGYRGRRAMRAMPTAKTRLIILLAVTLLSGTATLAVGDAAVRLALIGCLAIAMISFSVTLHGKHRSLGGQLLGVVGLSAPCVPILLAGGVDAQASVAIWGVWLLGFTATTVAVRGVIAAHKRQSRTLLWTVLIVVSLWIAIRLVGRSDWALAVLPMVAMSWYLMLEPPPARHLKRIGWTLVSGTIATAIMVVIRF